MLETTWKVEEAVKEHCAKMRNVCKDSNYESQSHCAWGCAYKIGYDDGRKDEKEESVEHGEWQEVDFIWDMHKGIMCSVCSKIFHCENYWKDRRKIFRYCPNCGAKMEEEYE